MQEGHLPAVGQSVGVGQSGRESVRQPSTPSDTQRREGYLSNAPQLRLPAPLHPILQLQSGMTSEDRLAVLEGMMMDVRADLQAIRDDMRNILRAAKEVSEDSQQVALRIVNLEFEWLNWNDGWHNEVTSPEQQHVEENQDMVLLTPAGTAQASGNVHADLLGLDSDPLLQWWDAAAPQRDHQSSGPLPSGLPNSGRPAIFTPGGGEEQFSAGGTALRSAPQA